jgi:hypothetical protein
MRETHADAWLMPYSYYSGRLMSTAQQLPQLQNDTAPALLALQH